jgi:hypothetical protein
MRDLRAARNWDAIKTMVAEALEELPEERRQALSNTRGRREVEEDETVCSTDHRMRIMSKFRAAKETANG